MDYLFGAVKVTQNADLDKYFYFLYVIGLDSQSFFLILNFDVGKNFNIFGVDNNSSMHTDNRKNKFQFLLKDHHKDQAILK